MHWSASHLLRCVLVACAFQAPLAATAAAQEPANPFADFESFRLGNGLKVWYRHLPGSITTSMAVIVPAGSDDDPDGREQSAHLLEHVLLSDRHGRSEAELARELTNRGGTHNGITAADYSYYPVHIGSDDAAFALEWLHGVVAPRIFTDALVERNREPVAIETGARRRSALERLALHYVHFPPLRPPGFWRREFGLRTADDRVVDLHAALNSISAPDLQRFYDRHYASATMTLVIVSGLPRAVLQPVLNTTFATMPWRPAPEPRPAIQHREGESRRFSYHLARSTRLSLFFRVRSLDARDHLRLIFIEDLLRLRLLDRLRRGADKFIYSAHVSMETRSGAAFLRIALDVDPDQERLVRRVVEEEIQRVRTAQVDTAAFYADRDALGQRLRVQTASPGRLVELAASRFHDPAVHAAFPDVGAYYASVGPDSIAALALRVFAAENRIIRVLRPPPFGLAWIALFALLAGGAAAALYRARTFRNADMGRIRFVGRIRYPAATRMLGAAGAALLLLAALRLGAAAVQFAAEFLLLTIDSTALHAAALAMLVALTTLAAFTTLGLLHSKVLVFEDEIRLKSPTWRATIIPVEDVREARIVQSAKGLRLRRPALPAPGPAVFLALHDGSGYLLHVRRPEALATAVESLASRSSIP